MGKEITRCVERESLKKNLPGVVAAFASDRSPLNQPEAEAVCGGALRSNLVNKTVNKMANKMVNKVVNKMVNKMVKKMAIIIFEPTVHRHHGVGGSVDARRLADDGHLVVVGLGGQQGHVARGSRQGG